MLLSLYFIWEKGYDVKHIELHQDDILDQLLEINSKFFSLSKTKYIKAKIFFIKDKVNDGDVVIKDCPTEVMWADIITTPEQRKSFSRTPIMGTNWSLTRARVTIHKNLKSLGTNWSLNSIPHTRLDR